MPDARWRHLTEDEGDAVWFMGNLTTVKAGEPEGFTLMDVEYEAGHGPPRHVHHGEDESFHVLRGKVRFSCDDQEFDAGPGDSVTVPRGTVHAFKIGDEGARMLIFGTSWHLAGFMVEAGRPATARELPPPGEHDMDAVVEVAGRHDMTVVGPPLERGPG